MEKKQPESLEGFDLSRELLKLWYQHAKEKSELLLPDKAIKRLSKIMEEMMKREGRSFTDAVMINPKLDPLAKMRELHHFVVDLFYDTYFGRPSGAPRLHSEYLKYIVSLREQGLSYGQIAKKVGLPVSPPSEYTKSKDKIRKQLDEAKERGITS